MTTERRQLIALILLTIGAFSCEPGAGSVEARPETPGLNPARKQTSPVERAPLVLPLQKPHIVVRKGERKLELYSENLLLRTYKVGLGFNPGADKEKEGDGATPEGDFYIFVKNNKSAYYLSLGLSYPNAEDAERGLRDGLITKTQYNSVIKAMATRSMPPQYTKLGGLIYIHGNGARSDWTWGCVALENEDIKELYDAVTVGTPVRILK